MRIVVETLVVESTRVLQVRGLFDLQSQKSSRREWDVDLPLAGRDWRIGLIVGPSGSGKSTVARALFGPRVWGPERMPAWPAERSVLDGFPAGMGIKEVVGLLCAVGFSSPPAWLRPFPALSTGEQFRANLARLLAEAPDLAVMDEYTSVIDRTAAQVGSTALARAVRAGGRRFVAVTCHEDVEEWLQPDWVYRPAEEKFAWRSLQRRPAIELQISRVHRSAWALFRHHHYLSGRLAPAAVCFAAFWKDRPVAFSAWVQALGVRGTKREHRTVCLPDYQGVGIGQALADFGAALWKARGYRVVSTTSHPAMIAARRKSPHWRLTRRPALGRRDGRRDRPGHALTRLTAGFEYVGPAHDGVDVAWVARPDGTEGRGRASSALARPSKTQGVPPE